MNDACTARPSSNAEFATARLAEMRQVARDGLHEAYSKNVSFTPAIDWAYDFFAGFPWRAERFEAVKALMFADPGFLALRAELAAKIGHDIFSDPAVARNE